MRNSFLAAVTVVLAFMGLAVSPATAQAPAAEAVYVTSDATIPAGDVSLSTRLYAPVGLERFPVVVLVTGSGNESEIDGPYYRILARTFAARGIGVLAYDKRGVGGSTGTYTGSDFAGLGADAAAVANYALSLPQVEAVGMWGISQAGWIIPSAVRRERSLRFAILVSPAGVNPHEQVSYFLYRQALSWGLSPEEAAETDRMHRAVSLYYAGRASHGNAQVIVDSYSQRRWFHAVVTHPYWDEMSPEGVILTPDQLAAALQERPGAFEIYREHSSFVNYAGVYRALRRLPTLIIYGGADELVPVDQSRPLFERALRGEHRRAHDFRVFAGASHDIQTPEGRVYPDYLAAMADWARAQFDGGR